MMKITIVYDNLTVKAGLKTGWGFSSLIKTDDAPPLLFDTGADGATLLRNMNQLGINPGRIGVIVISHHHYDHTGGLSDVLETNKHAEIYVPASTIVRLPGRKVVQVSQPVQISEAVFPLVSCEGLSSRWRLKRVRV